MRLSLKNTSEVCHYFANQVQNEGYAGNVKFQGNDFYSYRTIVAKRINGFIVMSTRSYSVTTAGHLSDLRYACNHKDIIYIPCVEDNAERNENTVKNEINALFKLASTARTKKDFYLSKALATAKDFNKYCEITNHVNLIVNLDMFENVDLSAIKASEKQRQAVELAKRKEREAENALANSVKIEQWLNGERDNLGYGVSSNTLLRVKGDMIQTSRGAEITLTDAPNIWALVNTVKAGGRSIQINRKTGVYRMTNVSCEGDITVGCHEIQYKELQRIAKVLGYM